MILSLLLDIAAAIAVAVPHVTVDRQGSAYVFAISGRNDFMDQCVRGGLELRYRYDVKLCRKRSFWFDDCKSEKHETNAISYEPISESYRVIRDRHGDGKDPSTLIFNTLDGAFELGPKTDPITLDFLSHGDLRIQGSKRAYLQYRAVCYCTEQGGNTLQAISRGMTFGLVRVERFDSGWMSIFLADE